MMNGGLAVLVTDDYDDPSWYPIQAFTVADGTLPDGWVFRVFPGVEPGGKPGEYQVQAIWGYTEMVYSDEHNDLLMDRQAEARAIFYAARERQEGISGQSPADSLAARGRLNSYGPGRGIQRSVLSQLVR